MASIAHWKYGDTNPVPVLCDPTTPIEVGDLLYQDPGTHLAKPASAMLNQGSEGLNQDAFQMYFLGVAMQKNGLQPGEVVPLGSTANHSPANVINCATTGNFEFPCAAATWNTGDRIGAANNTANTALLNQTVKAAASASLAIGRAVPEANAINVSRTSVIVRIKSTILEAGVQNQVVGSSSGAV